MLGACIWSLHPACVEGRGRPEQRHRLILLDEEDSSDFYYQAAAKALGLSMLMLIYGAIPNSLT